MRGFRQSSRARRAGFTIVEVLVAIGIMAVLLALLVPALSGVKKRGMKTRELNNIKQVGQAWMMYGNNNDDAALPGFLEAPVQVARQMGVSRGWGVTYKQPNAEPVPLTTENLTGPWTWRLLSYLSWNHELIHQHLDESDPSPTTLLSEGTTVAYEPAFGYNGYYIGGWWRMQKFDGVDTPMPLYHDHCRVGAIPRALKIPTTISQISRASDMITFCSAIKYPGTGAFPRLSTSTPGWHVVMPPMMEQTERWRPSTGDPIGLALIAQPGTSAPFPRYTNSIAVLAADGHVDQEGFNALHDMRRWVSDADDVKFHHAPCGTPD